MSSPVLKKKRNMSSPWLQLGFFTISRNKNEIFRGAKLENSFSALDGLVVGLTMLLHYVCSAVVILAKSQGSYDY